MLKRISLLLAVALMAVMMMAATVSPAFAASSQQECEDAGGNFSRTQGRASCEFPEVITPGKNERQEKFQQTSQTTETGQGNLDNKEADTTTNTCGKPCPPGQFK